MRAFLNGLIALGLFAFANLSSAQAPATLYYQTYLNLDGNPATGCAVTVPDITNTPQTLLGVDVSLVVTVTNGILVSAERFACVGGILDPQGADPGHPTYTLGGAFIEYRIPNVAITPQTTVGFAASTSPNFDNPSDVFFESSPGQPISLAPLLRDGSGNVPIPVSTPILLFLIAVAAGLIAARYLRTPQGRRIGAIALIFCLTGISGAVYSAAQIVLDGKGHSWIGVPVLATDPEGDAQPPEIDLLRVYGVHQDNTLYFKLDLKQKPDSNTPPRIVSDPVVTGTIGTAYSYQVDAEDDDGDALTYSLTEAPAGMTIDNSGLITWASPVLGTHNITVRVSDGQAHVEQSYTLTINAAPPVNTPPRITSDPVTTGTVGTAYSYQVDAEDDDGDPLTYSLTEAPTGMTIDSDGLITWASPVLGTHNITVRVSDGQAHVEQSYTLTINAAPPVNTPPRITSDPVTTGTVGTAYSYQVDAEDDDGDPLTYSLAEAPTGMTIDSDGLITWASPALGTHNITVRVSDGQAHVEQSYTLTINAAPPVNTPPRIVSDPITTGIVGTAYSYQVDAEDDDGDALTYSLTESPTGMTIDSDGLITWASPVLGTHNITVRVSDGQATDEQSYILTINAAPPPVIVVDVNMTQPATGSVFTQNSTISLKASASITNGSISKLEFFNGSALLGTGAFSGGDYVYPWSTTVGDYSIFARVTDNLDGTHDSPPVNIKVCNTPTLAFTSPSDGAQTTAPGEWTLSVTANTETGCGMITQVAFYNGLELLHIATNTPYTYLWQNVPAGSYTLTAKATDSLGGTSEQSVNVSVTSAAPTPEITLASPANGSIYQEGSAVSLAASTNLSSTEVKSVEFFAGANRVAVGTLSEGQYTAAWTAPVGNHTVFARLTDQNDATYDSDSVTITVKKEEDICVPEVSLTDPADGATVTAPGELVLTAQASVDTSCGVITKVEFYGGTWLLHTATAAPYTYTWKNIPSGNYTLIAKAFSTNADNTSEAIQITVESDEPAPELHILTPTDGATINNAMATVTGIFTYTPGAVIIANGREARIKEDGSFTIHDVPLQPGENTLAVVLNTREHEPVTKEITVTSEGDAPITVSLTPAKGVAPLEAVLAVLSQEGRNLGSYCLNLKYSKDGGAMENLTALEDADKRVLADEEARYSYTFSEDGVYTVHIQLMDRHVEGQPECSVQAYTATRTLVVNTPAQLGEEVADTYWGMLEQLSQNRPDKALKYFIGDMQERYSNVFNELDGDLPQIAEQISEVVNGVVGESVAELMVKIDTPDGKQLFQVYLMRGNDGVWRISGM